MQARIRSGDTERIQTPALKDGSLAALTGLTTVLLAIQRVSDGFWYDFNDDTFKSTGWTTRQQQMTEVSATLAPGEYYYDFDTSSITNATADDSYMLRVDEATSAANVPLHGELKVDQWVDDLFDEHAATQADIAALNDPSAADVADAVWDEALAGHAGAGSAGEAQAHLDADISSRSSHSAADVDTQLSGSHGAGSWATATGFSTHSAADAADAVWDEAIAGHSAGGSAGAELQAKAEPGDAMDLVTDAVDAAAVATSGANEVRDAILSDSTPFAGANIDAAVSSRSSHSPSDVDTTLSASHGAGSWATATGFSTHSPADVADAVWDEAIAGHSGAGSAGEELQGKAEPGDAMALTGAAVDAVWDEPAAGHVGAGTVGEQQNRLDAAVSSRSSHTPADVDTQLSGSHGAGSWQTATGFSTHSPADVADAVWDEALAGHAGAGSAGEALDLAADGDWTNLEQQEIRQALGVTGAKNPTAGGDLQAVLTDTSVMQPIVAARLDVAVSSRSSHSPADAADAVWDEGLVGHLGGGSTGAALNAKAEPGDAMDLVTDAVDSNAVAASGAAEVASAVDSVLTAAHGAGSWQEPTLAQDWSAAEREDIRDALGIQGTKGSAAGGQLQDVLADTAAMEPLVSANLDAAVSSRSSHTPANVDSQLSGSHGAGSWATATGFAAPGDAMALTPAERSAVADAVWDEALGGHSVVGSAGKELADKAEPGDAMTLTGAAANDVADRVWDEALGGHLGAGSTGEALDAASAQAPSAATVAAAVWNETLPGGFPAGSAGERLATTDGRVDQSLSATEAAIRGADGDDLKVLSDQIDAIPTVTPPTAAAVADAVWDEAVADHQSAGSFGRGANLLGADSVVAASPAPTAATFATGLTEPDSFWDGVLVVVVDVGGTGRPVPRNVSAYAQADGLITVDPPLPFTPTAGDPVLLLRLRGAAAVEEETVASGTTC